ncbi:MAG: hypothetical protein KDC03_03015 [Flavobacteriales bacterium]|nr:hypothetical protein [Flavobacteriales bacterium]MCB0784951.1 hypothetical protein [Flavobacteriales bacterium]
MVNKKRLDRLVPLAMELLANQQNGMVNKDGSVSGTYHGYVSSFGAMMALSSPLAAALQFENSEQSEKDKGAVTRTILKVMKADPQGQAQDSHAETLSEYLQPLSGTITRRHKQDLAAACIALKLALRCYPKGQ